MRRTFFITAALVLGLAGSASAQDTAITATLNPNAPGVGSKLHVAIGGAAAELGGALPEAVTLHLQRGFKLDLATIVTRCDALHAPAGDCPEASRVGRGAALAHTSGLISADVQATIDIFLADAVQAGDLASVVLRVNVANQSRSVQARLRALPSGRYGYELSADGFAAAIPSLPGLAVELRGMTLDLGVSRNVRTTVTKRVRVRRNGKRVTVRRKVKRTVRHDLIRNPRTCAGTWAARVTVRVAGTDRVRDLTTPCARR